jgi:hypothetical protein
MMISQIVGAAVQNGGFSVIIAATISASIGVTAFAQGSTQPGDYAAVVQQICRQYAAAQHGLPYNTMFAQCMYARGYRVPGFSPSPNSPGYQGELPGPAAHNGGA